MHVIESQQFSPYSLDYIFKRADKMENVRPGSPEAKQLDGRIMSTLFYEPSTRTRLSFESAMTRLGGQVLSTENAGSFSSAAKGETLEGRSHHSRLLLQNLALRCLQPVQPLNWQITWLLLNMRSALRRYYADDPVLC